MSVSVLPQLLGDSGPVVVNLMTMVCVVFAQGRRVPVAVIHPPRATVVGDTDMARPQFTCSPMTEEALAMKFVSPP